MGEISILTPPYADPVVRPEPPHTLRRGTWPQVPLHTRRHRPARLDRRQGRLDRLEPVRVLRPHEAGQPLHLRAGEQVQQAGAGTAPGRLRRVLPDVRHAQRVHTDDEGELQDQRGGRFCDTAAGLLPREPDDG